MSFIVINAIRVKKRVCSFLAHSVDPTVIYPQIQWNGATNLMKHMYCLLLQLLK